MKTIFCLSFNEHLMFCYTPQLNLNETLQAASVPGVIFLFCFSKVFITCFTKMVSAAGFSFLLDGIDIAIFAHGTAGEE
jgi:hypothetical protein